MGVARWRWVLVPLVVVVAGCVSPPPLSADLLRAFETEGMSFQAARPGTGAMSAAATLEHIRANHSRSFLGAEPLRPAIFGVASCLDQDRCTFPGPPVAVWIFSFPGQQANMAPPRPEESIVVNAANGDTLVSVGR